MPYADAFVELSISAFIVYALWRRQRCVNNHSFDPRGCTECTKGQYVLLRIEDETSGQRIQVMRTAF